MADYPELPDESLGWLLIDDAPQEETVASGNSAK